MNNKVVINNYQQVLNYIKNKEKIEFAKKSPNYKNITYLHNVNIESTITDSMISRLIDYAFKNKLRLSVYHCN